MARPDARQRTSFDYRWLCVGLAFLLAAAPSPKRLDAEVEREEPALRSGPKVIIPK